METGAELTRHWVARIRRDDAVALARLRDESGVEAAFHGEEVWLRGSGESREVIGKLVDQPVVDLFESEDGVHLHPPGRMTPTDRMPKELAWGTLRELTRPTGIAASLPTVVAEKESLRLVRDEDLRPVNLMRLSLSELAGWAEGAPGIRFRGLSYACSNDGEVLVLGERLPAVSAERFVRREGIAVPAGWRLEPPVAASVIRSIVNAPTNSLVIFDPDGRAEIIEMNHFVPLTRASVRLTRQRMEAEFG